MDMPEQEQSADSAGDALEAADTRTPDDRAALGGEETPSELPPIYLRFLDAFVSPGKMAAYLAKEPKWAVALFLGAALIGLQFALIPSEIFAEAQRQRMFAAGQDPSQMPEQIMGVLGIITAVFGVLGTVLMTFVMAGLYALIFAFILGDQGKYNQYLAVVAHALFIPALIGLLLTPLRISTGNPQFTLNVASFLFFLPSGYWLGVFTAMDLSQIWSALVVAQGAHGIDRHRSFGSAAVILLVIVFAFALVFGRFVPT